VSSPPKQPDQHASRDDGPVLRSRVATTAPASAPAPLLAWLVARFRYLDERRWRDELAAGRVRVNGQVAGTVHVVAAGDEVAFHPGEATGEERLDVPVLAADDDLVVVDKPAHAVVQHATTLRRHAFVNALARRFPPMPPAQRLEPVHRLDRETSGVLVLARTVDATRGLQRQFEAGSVHKEYLAVVRGHFPVDRLVVDAPVGLPEGRTIAARRCTMVATAAGARPAVTEFVVERRLPTATLLRVVPRTGRTHQIRVHLEHVGHPLLGDKLYGQPDGRWLDYVRHLKNDGDPRWPGEAEFGRQLLHAARLVCRHPRSGIELDLRAPLPADFAPFVADEPQ
jgi:23S rRNA pseudouridine1911/1915/1917 synthase